MRRPRRQQQRGIVFTGMLLLGLTAGREALAQAVGITEISAGVNGNASAQFIEVRMMFADQHQWGPQPGETASRSILVFYDGAGNQTATFAFTADAPNTPNRYVLIGTQAFKDLTNQPDPDIIIPALLRSGSGKVCFRANPANPNAFGVDCIAYGNFPPAQNFEREGIPPDDFITTFGTPLAVQLPTSGFRSIHRKESHDMIFGFGFQDTRDNTRDFFLEATPSPSRSGNDLPQDSAADIAAGRQIFLNETFGGNGRTCASCHVLELNGGLPPSNIKQRFATLATTFDPLFIAERNMNLNTLTVNASAPFAEGAVLTGTAGGATARVKVRARLSSTQFLVHGGIDPFLTVNSNISDGTTTVRVVSIVKGDLDQLEDTQKMHGPSVSPAHPDGRGLILENPDGFDLAPVFRKSPHIQNLRFTGPFGFGDDVANLDDFSAIAVEQHFTRTMARRVDIDFRLPTTEEKRLLKVFMRSLDSVPGVTLQQTLDKFKLGHFARTTAQRRGRQLFENTSCNSCHFNTVLAGGRFPTGINAQPINGPAPGGDGLPIDNPEPGATTNRPMGTPGLFNVKHNAPFFHDGSRTTLVDAVMFYTSEAFRASPEGEVFFFDFTPAQANDVAAFLSGLVARDYVVLEGTTDVTREGSAVNAGVRFPRDPAVTRSLTVRNTSTTKSVSFSSPACSLALVRGTANEFPSFDCSQLNGVTLAPGAQRTISVTIDPASSGEKQAILELNTADPTGVDLQARGVIAEVDETFDLDGFETVPRFTSQRPATDGSFFFTSEGQLRMLTCFNCPAPNGNVLTHEFELPGSFTLSVEGIANASDSAVDDFSVIFNFQNINNYYYASFNERDTNSSGADDLNTNGIFKVVNGVRTQIRDFSATTAPGDFEAVLHKVRIEKVKGTIRVFRNGSLMGVVTDSTFSGGKAGVGSLNNDGRFDNFLVRSHVLGEDHTAATNPYTKVLGGTFAVSTGAFRLSSPVTNNNLPNANLAVHPTLLPSGDYELFVDGNATASSATNDDFTVVFNYQNVTNYMFVNFGEANDSASNGVFRVVNSVRTQIADFTTLTTPGTARRISVRKTGSTIRVFRDGTQIGSSVNDSTFTAGQIGVGSRDNAGTFDNVFVERQ
jgi:mono/diheme cytochrome c family protein